MRDAMGGSVTIVIIVVFIVIALGYMAFNVNYTKAFRMKDKILTLYDDYDGDCQSKCQEEIKQYAKQIGYSTGVGTGGFMDCPSNTSGYKAVNNIYCIKEIKTNNISDKKGESRYYSILTKINVEIPVIKNVLNFKFFYISGETKTYTN